MPGWTAVACAPLGKERRRTFPTKAAAVRWGAATARRVCGLPTFVVGRGKSWCLMLNKPYAREIGWGRK
jgi:hypothetical protein